MPVALLVGILVASVVINLALIVLVARADDFTLRAPRFLRSVLDLLSPDSRAAESGPRRRALYAPDQQPRPIVSVPATLQMLPFIGASRAGRAAAAPMTETLPPDLAEFLSRPAELALPPEDRGRGDGGADGLALPARWSQPASGGGFERGELERDGLARLESPDSWGRIVETENARLLRYRRPVTIVLVEVEGLEQPADRPGEEPVLRLLPVVADALLRGARSSDWVARIGRGRFAVLLSETDEIQAINYVERVRAVCEPGLASATVQLRLAIGWSSPTASSDLEFAIHRAEERLSADRRGPRREAAPVRAVAAAPATPASRAGGGNDRAPFEPGVAPLATETTRVAAASAEPAAGEPPPNPTATKSGSSRSRRKRGTGSGKN